MGLTEKVKDNRVVKYIRNIDYPSSRELVSFGVRFVAFSIVGTAAGAVSGEILDHLPYFREALPKAAEMMYSLRGGVNPEVYDFFYGNLDKICAPVGFVSGAVSSRRNGNKKEK